MEGICVKVNTLRGLLRYLNIPNNVIDNTINIEYEDLIQRVDKEGYDTITARVRNNTKIDDNQSNILRGLLFNEKNFKMPPIVMFRGHGSLDKNVGEIEVLGDLRPKTTDFNIALAYSEAYYNAESPSVLVLYYPVEKHHLYLDTVEYMNQYMNIMVGNKPTNNKEFISYREEFKVLRKDILFKYIIEETGIERTIKLHFLINV